MTNEEMWALLIRLDERTAASQRWEVQHNELHEKEKAGRWKVIAPIYAALVGVLTKVIFWS